MFFLVRLMALAILGPMTMAALEESFIFGLLLSALSLVLTVWLVIDAITAINSVVAWAGGK
jgi:hypothetical protein